MAATARFFRSLLLLMLFNAVIKPLWVLGIDRQVQNVTGTGLYGNYFALFNFAVIFSFLLDLGLTTWYNQSAAAGLQAAKGSFRQVGRLKFLLGFIYALAVMLAGWLWQVENLYLLALISFNQFLLSLLMYFRSHLTALQYFKADSFFSILDKLLVILVAGWLLYLSPHPGRMTPELFMWIQVGASFASLSALGIFLLRRHPTAEATATGNRLNLLHLKKAWPFALIFFLMGLHNRADGFLLERLHPSGPHEAGVYAAAFRLLDVFNMAGFLVAGFLMPFIARHQTDSATVKTVVLRSRNWLMAACIPAVGVVAGLAGWWTKLLYHHADDYSARILALCIAALPAYALVHIYGTLLGATGRIADFLRICAPVTALNLILNALLIPSGGAAASAVAALVTQYLFAFLLMAYSTGRGLATLNSPSLLKYLVLALATAGAVWLAGHWPMPVGARLAIIVLVPLSLILLMRLISLRDLREMEA